MLESSLPPSYSRTRNPPLPAITRTGRRPVETGHAGGSSPAREAELGRTTFHPAGKAVPGGQTLAVGVACSIGIATYPEAGTTWEELFKGADDALYISKRSGRNRSTAWSPSAKNGHAHANASDKPAAA